MNRVDELTLKMADGSLAAEERQELERLVAASPEAAREHASLLDLVAVMRGESGAPDLTEKTLERIHERITSKIEVGVMHKIRLRGKERAPVRGSVRRAHEPERRGAIWAIAAVAAALLVAVAIAIFGPSSETDVEHARATPKKVETPIPAPKPIVPDPPVKESPVPPKVEKPSLPPPALPEPEKSAPPPAPEKKPETPAPVEEKKPEPKPEPAPPPAKPAPPTETIVVVATLEKAEKTYLLVRGEKISAKAGQDLLEGQGLEAEGPATIKFPDGSRLELRARTLLREIVVKNGKQVDVARGILVAQVAEQPADRPMVFVTPQAELRILGTAFRLSVDPEAEGATQLDVTEGKVRVKRLADGKTADVARGSAVAIAKGAGPMAPQPHTGLIAHWKLDETAGTLALDSSGNLHHATAKGDTSWIAGRLGGGLHFGAGGHLSVPGFKLPETFTISFWVFQPALNKEQDWLVNFGSNDFLLMREGNMDPRQVRTGFENPQEFLTVPSSIQARQWTHLAVTYDGAELRLYSNGASIGVKKSTRREFRPDATFGRVAAGSEAVLDDIRIYDRWLPATDVARIMAGVSPLPAGRR